MRIVFIAVLVVTLSGCAFWDGFTRGLSGGESSATVTVESVGEVAGYAVVDSVDFFPSPWKEILIALISGVTGWSAATRKGKEE